MRPPSSGGSGNILKSGNGQVPDEVEGEGGQNGERNVRGRPARGNPDHATRAESALNVMAGISPAITP